MAKISELLSTIRSTALKKEPRPELIPVRFAQHFAGWRGRYRVSEASCPRTQNKDDPISL